MKKSKNPRRSYSSTLTLRLWEFSGTALLTLFIWIFLLILLSPLSYMLVTSLELADQFRERTAPIWPAERLTYTYQGKLTSCIKSQLRMGSGSWPWSNPAGPPASSLIRLIQRRASSLGTGHGGASLGFFAFVSSGPIMFRSGRRLTILTCLEILSLS